ncbi:MAG: DUF3131 domain-containing protein [Gemmatimonadetes bacterium]|nr:DUF3131 domain-containing protein [Gemmatimonadota bacterium]
MHADHALFLQAARTAWNYMEREYQPGTGWVNSVSGYPYATVWDIASALSGLYSAHRLGLVGSAEYDRRMRRSLRSLQTVRLFDGTALSKNYSTATGTIAGRDDRDTLATDRGTGWSAIDIGRLLVWLKVISTNEPQYAADINRIVARLDFSTLVSAGYLQGATADGAGKLQRYTEGRVGYEQYAAAGFALWGYRAEEALNLGRNTIPITVMDVPLVADRRGYDHLTSEPFVLMGLEVGWTPEMGDLASRVLRVQEERYRRTGQVTMVSEDAIPVAPYYFYYYSINYHGHQFVVGAQDADVLQEPRWVSAKAAFGWHALLPGGYTRLAVDAVAVARGTGRAWSSGVFEKSRKSTGGENVNTAAVILESALHSVTGRPLLAGR